jgi:hypothetical protein
VLSLPNELKRLNGTSVRLGSTPRLGAQQTNVKYAPPSRDLLALHAAIAKVTHAVGGGECKETPDTSDNDELECDVLAAHEVNERTLSLLDNCLRLVQKEHWSPRVFSGLLSTW